MGPAKIPSGGLLVNSIVEKRKLFLKISMKNQNLRLYSAIKRRRADPAIWKDSKWIVSTGKEENKCSKLMFLYF